MSETNETIQAIELVQNPVLKHRINEIGESVTNRIEELNLKNLVVTDDNIQVIKKLRAELNRENGLYESQFKVVETAYLEPFKEVKDIKKIKITDIYKNADDILKDSITKCELTRKTEKKNAVEAYFNELCVAEKIDFVKFEQVIPEINLSTTEKKYKENVNEFITKVIDDLNLIKTTEFEAEILTLYKTTLNVSHAITSVKERKEKEKIEADRIKAAENVRRQNLCKSLGMSWMSSISCYEYNAEIGISKEEIETLTKDEFISKIAKCEAEIKDLKAKELEKRQAEIAATTIINEPEKENPTQIQAPKIEPTPVAPIAPVAPPISEPVVIVEEKIYVSTFRITASRQAMLDLQQYIITNNLKCENL